MAVDVGKEKKNHAGGKGGTGYLKPLEQDKSRHRQKHQLDGGRQQRHPCVMGQTLEPERSTDRNQGQRQGHGGHQGKTVLDEHGKHQIRPGKQKPGHTPENQGIGHQCPKKYLTFSRMDGLPPVYHTSTETDSTLITGITTPARIPK